MYGRMEMAKEKERKPVALFMAFGTKGDVHPIAAIAVAFACDQEQYDVIFVTHSAHEKLSLHLVAKKVNFLSVSSPPVLSPFEDKHTSGSLEFSMQKSITTKEHRRECVFIFERIFGDDPSMEGDFVMINFFALEGWSLAELFHVRCVVAAPYVVPYSAPSSFERCFRKELPLLYEYLQEAPVDKKSSPMHPLVSATAVFAAGLIISCILISDKQRRAKQRRRAEHRRLIEQKNKLIEELNQVEEQNREEEEKHKRMLDLDSTLDRWLRDYKEMNADFEEMNARLSSHMERFEVERSKSSPAHTSLESSSPPQDSRDLIF